MNDNFTNYNREEDISQKINQVVEQTNVNSQFAAELEERLRSAYQPKTNWFAALFQKVSPTAVWIALMVLLVLVLSLSITTLVPKPQPAMQGTPVRQVTSTPTPNSGDGQTPAPDGKSFDYNSAKLILSASLPDSPGQANVYTMLDSQPATADYAKTLANQFGIDGEIYRTEGHMPDTSALMVTDGKQQLVVYADNDYEYTSDMVKNLRNRAGFENENAESIIHEYLKAHNLDFSFHFDSANAPSYVLEQLAEDGKPIKYAFNSGPSMNIALDEEGNVLSLRSLLAKYDPAPLGQYRIISAEAALNLLLDENQYAGKIDNSSGPPGPVSAPLKYWFHDYPTDQTFTIGGEKTSYSAVDTTKAAVIFIDNLSVIGNTNGMEKLIDHSYVLATGQFILENGVRKFKVDSWKQMTGESFTGSAHREGDQIIVEQESGTRDILVDPPPDLQLDLQPPEGLYFRGAIVDGKLYWSFIQYIPDVDHMGGGGGGGGGVGFYKLNLSGTPVPFPTATPVRNTYTRAELASFLRYTVQPGDTLEQIAETYHVSIEDLKSVNSITDSEITFGWPLTIPGVPGPTRLDGERGIVQVQLYDKPDGRRRTQYTFVSEKDQYLNYELRGDNLEPLQKVRNRPIKIWGSLSFDEQGTVFIDVEKFEALYPDLQFQNLRGAHETKDVNGVQVSFFTTGGTTYAELVLSGGYPYQGYSEVSADATVEALQVPNETYAGYPAIRVYTLLPTQINPQTGKPYELAPIADILEPLPDPFGNADSYIPPDVTIESVDLMYVADDSSEVDANAESAPQHYIQPAWHFHGHDANGGQTDILIQALEQKYLLPEPLP